MTLIDGMHGENNNAVKVFVNDAVYRWTILLNLFSNDIYDIC